MKITSGNGNCCKIKQTFMWSNHTKQYSDVPVDSKNVVLLFCVGYLAFLI